MPQKIGNLGNHYQRAFVGVGMLRDGDAAGWGCCRMGMLLCGGVAVVASWRARASAWRRRRWRSIVVGVVESRVGGLDARDGDGLIGATGNCDPEVQVVSVDNTVWAGVGRGEGGLHASPSYENVRAVV